MIATAGVNPLTTNDTFWHRQTLAVCYQLAQSILKIGFTSYIPHFCSCGLWQFDWPSQWPG